MLCLIGSWNKLHAKKDGIGGNDGRAISSMHNRDGNKPDSKGDLATADYPVDVPGTYTVVSCTTHPHFEHNPNFTFVLEHSILLPRATWAMLTTIDEIIIIWCIKEEIKHGRMYSFDWRSSFPGEGGKGKGLMHFLGDESYSVRVVLPEWEDVFFRFTAEPCGGAERYHDAVDAVEMERLWKEFDYQGERWRSWNGADAWASTSPK